MTSYRRAWHPGGTYYFTVVLHHRQGNDLLIREIDLLRAVVAIPSISMPGPYCRITFTV